MIWLSRDELRTLQQGKLLLVHGESVANLGQLKHLLGIIGPGTCADELFSGADGKHHLGEMRRKRNYALCGSGWRFR